MNLNEKLMIKDHKNEMNYLNKSQNWYIPNDDTSWTKAKDQIDKLKIIGVVDKVYQFTEDVISLFKKNNPNTIFNDIRDDIKKNIKYNKSSVKINDNIFTTNELKQMLSKKDIKKIEENNQLDMQLWEYVHYVL